jgi:hypothetical protein
MDSYILKMGEKVEKLTKLAPISEGWKVERSKDDEKS